MVQAYLPDMPKKPDAKHARERMDSVRADARPPCKNLEPENKAGKLPRAGNRALLYSRQATTSFLPPLSPPTLQEEQAEKPKATSSEMKVANPEYLTGRPPWLTPGAAQSLLASLLSHGYSPDFNLSSPRQP